MEKQAANLKLQGGMIHLTGVGEQAFRVLSGHVLVYILPIQEGKAGRRYLLHEAVEGESIPGFCEEAPFSFEQPELCLWQFGLVALDKAELVQLDECTEDCVDAFAKAAALSQYEALGFTEAVLEEYQLNITTELRNIYTATMEQETTYAKGLGLILDFFRRGEKKEQRENTGNALYDAVSYICDKKDIPLASFDVVRASSGRRFTLHDVARLSHFTIRGILLSEKWYKQDSGPILAFTENGKNPIACIPKGPSKYIAYDPAKGTSRVVSAAYAAALSPKAFMFYRPLPNRKIKPKDLFRFGLKDLYARDVVTMLALLFVGTLIGLLIPYMNEQLYDSFIPMGNETGLVQVCWVVLSCMMGNAAFSVVQNLATLRSTNTMKYSVQSAVYNRLFSLPESFFREYDSADLAMRAMGVSGIYAQVSNIVIGQGLGAIFSMMYLFRMFKYSSKLSWISIVMLLLTMAVIAYLGWRQTRFEARKMELEGKISSLMYQLLSGISKLRIAGVENRALFEYLKPYTESRKIDTTKERLTIFSDVVNQAVPVVYSIVFFYLMVRQSMDLSMGAFMGFVSAFGSFSGAMLSLVSGVLQVNEVIPAYDRVRPILETLPEVEEDTALPGDITGAIEVSNVTFAYDEQIGPVINDLSISIDAGEYIGVVGSSGCGKSTLLKLLLGFEKPQYGKIFYDGRDIDGMDKRELRKKFGVVLQDGGLISGSIYENITITAPNATMKRVKEVIKEVGLEDDIEQMPMGLHTVLSEGSGSISGGQQQRILIARALVGKPKVIFFDEATSALDNVTQSMVCQSLEALSATRLVIAHRLSTVMNCDRILVMDQGRLVEQGSYAELMDLKGRFYELASRQLS